jgi:hypothetical protein
LSFRLAQSESAAEWEHFLGDLIRRGLLGDGIEMIGVDSGSGLLAALPQTGKIAGGRITADRARFRRPSARAHLPRV